MVKFGLEEYYKWKDNQKALEKKQLKEGYFWDTKDPGFGMGDINQGDYLKMKGGFKNEYWKLKGQLLTDPGMGKIQEKTFNNMVI